MVEMKPSGVQWLGDIPKEWNLAVLGKYVTQVKNKNTALLEKNLLSLSYGKIKRKDISSNDGLLPASFDGYNIIEEGDIVLRLTDLQNDHTSLRVGRATERGIITSAYVTIRPEKYISSEYLYYVLHSFDIVKGFYGMGAGIRQGLTYDGVQSLKISSPSLSEQQAIAAYLDDRCSKIDEIIAEASASIEEYKELKQAVIFEAVTKGLNKNVPMKDSGVEWIGNIPEHWFISKLKTRTAMLTPMRDKPEDLTGEIPWIRIVDFDGKYIYQAKDHSGVSMETVQKMNLKIYPVGTVLCTSSCDLGKCAIVSRELVSNQRFIGIIPKSGLYSDYLYYLMLANSERLNVLSRGTIQANLSRTEFEQLLVQFPPLEEQKNIALYLDEKTAEIDVIISEKQNLIEDLQAYKKSLIYEVVTGKRRIV